VPCRLLHYGNLEPELPRSPVLAHICTRRYGLLHPTITVKAGTVEEWYLFNATPEVHAFHIHQVTTVVEDAATGTPITEDTVFVPLGKMLPNPQDPNYPLVEPSVTRVLLDFRHSPRGRYVFHCHMMFHEDNGMMATIRVI